MVVGTIGTTIVNSYSNYLSDRNARIERLNAKPLNYIRVDLITYEDYLKMIDRRNWKSSTERIEEEKNEEENKAKQGTFEYKKNELIKSINSWLANNTKKKNTNDEIDEETLKKMNVSSGNFDGFISSDANGIGMENTRFETEDGKTGKKKKKKKDDVEYEIVDSRSKLEEISGVKKSVLPPSKRVKEKRQYFVVRECKNCATNRVLDVKLSRKKQKISVKREEDKTIVGKLGGQNIRKDDSIFDSLGRIWRAILHIKSDDKYQIIDSRYDQYGNRIKDATQAKKSKKQKEKKEKQKKAKDDYEILEVEFEDEEEQKQQVQNEELVKTNDVQKEGVNFLKNEIKSDSNNVFSFVIDGSLQEMDKYNRFEGVSTGKNSNSQDLQMLAYLEYTLENCWYGYAKEYRGQNLEASFLISWDDNTNLQSIKLLSESEESRLNRQFKDDVVNSLQNCGIARVKYLSKNNYSLWKSLKLTFKSGV